MNFVKDSTYGYYDMWIDTKNPTSKLIGSVSDDRKTYSYMPILFWNDASTAAFKTINFSGNTSGYNASVTLYDKKIIIHRGDSSTNMTGLNGQKMYLVFRK